MSARGFVVATALGVLLVACGGNQGKAKAPGLPPANPQAVSKMARGVDAAKSKESRDQAIQLLRDAVNADTKLWEARYDLGVLLAETGDLAAAEKELAAAAELAPNAEDVLVALAEVRRRQGDAPGAVSALESFVKDHPEAGVARIALVGALREDGRVDEAIAQAQQALVRRAGDPNALSELALAYVDKGELDTAELLSQESLKADEKSAVAERTAGLVALEQGNDALAFKHFARASELDPSDTTARLNMGTVLLQAGVYDRSSEHFRAVLERKPQDVPAQIGLAAALRGLGSRDNKAPYLEAEKILKQVLSQHSREPSAAYNLGVLYADYLGKPAEAKAMFEQYLDNASRSDPAREEAKKALAALK